MAAALHVFGSAPWGVGIGHGLEATTGRMAVTRAKGNVVYELDGVLLFDCVCRGLILKTRSAPSWGTCRSAAS